MFTCNYTMSVTCSLSESSSGCSSADVPAGLFPFGLLDSNAFPFSTQPIVYYAELPELYGKKQKGQEKKNKRNHFVKAFHWYKRDHCASKKTAVETFDIGFATWLDHKYQQYLRDRSRNASFKSEVSNVQTPTVNQNVMLLRLPKWCSASGMFAQAHTDDFQAIMRKKITSLMGRVRESRNSILKVIVDRFSCPIMWHWMEQVRSTLTYVKGSYKSTKPKGLRRILKSPWRKRHAVDNTLEEGHCCTECKESWQTILRPKSLSRFESENCTQKRSNGASSKITVTSSDTQVVIKSNKRDLIVQEITPRSDDASYLDKNISDKETPNIDELFSKKKLGKKKRNKSKIIKCECPVEENEIASNYKTDTVTLTQYDPNINIAEKPLKNATRTNVISKSGVLYKSTELMTPIATTNSYAARSKETIVLRKRKTDSEIDIKCECPAGSNESNNHYKQDMSVQHDQNNKDEETKRLENSTTTQVTIKPDFTNKSTGAISPKHEDRPKHIVCKCPMPFADEAAQTSDYAITPGRVTSGLPLFLRVVSTR